MPQEAMSGAAAANGITPFNAYTTAGVDGVSVSGTTTYYSAAVNTHGINNPSAHLQWTGTPTGAFTVWGSNKPSPGLADDSDWFSPPLGAAIAQPAGGASKDFVDLSGWSFEWLRIKYVNASGTGVVHSFMAGKP
jgi:hypothetical protein